jgi:vacuolar-type H+-ATPase subunit B/Vma2
MMEILAVKNVMLNQKSSNLSKRRKGTAYVLSVGGGQEIGLDEFSIPFKRRSLRIPLRGPERFIRRIGKMRDEGPTVLPSKQF